MTTAIHNLNGSATGRDGLVKHAHDDDDDDDDDDDLCTPENLPSQNGKKRRRRPLARRRAETTPAAPPSAFWRGSRQHYAPGLLSATTRLPFLFISLRLPRALLRLTGIHCHWSGVCYRREWSI
jgi:hypothetical protein